MSAVSFSRRELRDLTAAWAALGLAFTLFFAGSSVGRLAALVATPAFLALFGVSLVTVGVGFLLHELAHKVVAVRFGRPAEFRADYGMLLLAVAGGLAGFIFAAPGAVYHSGPDSPREQGLIALAGPVTNLLLAALFLPAAAVVGALWQGVTINLLLAAFNMLPVGPLDGRTVLRWHAGVYAAVTVPSVALAVWVLFG